MKQLRVTKVNASWVPGSYGHTLVADKKEVFTAELAYLMVSFGIRKCVMKRNLICMSSAADVEFINNPLAETPLKGSEHIEDILQRTCEFFVSLGLGTLELEVEEVESGTPKPAEVVSE